MGIKIKLLDLISLPVMAVVRGIVGGARDDGDDFDVDDD